jgi:hypothetical protein
MGATSVTGRGTGDSGLTRGPENNRDQFYSVVDPHVVWHGTATLEQVEDSYLGVATVYLPSTIRVPPEHLAVFVGGKGWTIVKNIDSDGMMIGFTIFGYTDTKVDYIVMDANNACFGDIYGNYI